MTEQEEFEFRLRLERERESATLQEPEMGVAEKTARQLARQVGLTARYGLEGVGGTLDLLASPFRAMLPKGLRGTGETGKAIADVIGLPSPEGSQERIVGDVTRGMASVAGFGGAGQISPMLQPLAPTVQGLVSAAGAGAGLGLAREQGAGTGGQIAASLAGGMFAPTAVGTAKLVGKEGADIASAIGASYGNQRGINRLAKDAAQRVAGESREEILDAIRNRQTFVPGVQPTVAESIAQPQIGRTGQFGGETIRLQKDLTGAKGLGDILPGAARTRAIDLREAKKATEIDLAPIRMRELDIVNQSGGVPSASVIQRIDDLLDDPKISELGEKTISKIRKRILEKEGLNADPDKINAESLYTIRKQISSVLKRASKKTEDWDAATSSKIQRDIQLAIDDALEGAGATRWKSEYMEPYAARMELVRKVKEGTKEAADIAKTVKSQAPSQLAAGDVPQLPGLLSRPVTAINFGLKLISRDANTPVARELAKRMLDPDQYAALLQVDPKTPLGMQVREVLKNAAIVGASQQREQ